MNLTDSGPQLTPANITAFEREIGGRLPDDYKSFLLEWNGGWTEPPLAFRWYGEVHEIPYFDPLLPTPDSNLRRGLHNLRRLGIDGYLPITSTQNDEDICLDFRKHIGDILIAVYSRVNDVAVAANLLFFASSFTEFLDKLFEIPEVYCPIEELGKKGTPDDLAAYLAEGNDLNAISKNGFSVLCEAIKFRNRLMIHACLEHGAKLYKSLHVATYTQQPDVIKLLVKDGADINEQDEYGHRPLSKVLGTALPDPEGALNREIEALLISLGAINSRQE